MKTYIKVILTSELIALGFWDGCATRQQQRPQFGYPLSEIQFQQIYLLGYSTALNDLQQVVKVLHDKQPS